MSDTEYIDYSGLAKYGIKPGTAYALVHQGRIPHVRLSKRLVRFSVKAIEAWLAEHAVEERNDQDPNHDDRKREASGVRARKSGRGTR